MLQATSLQRHGRGLRFSVFGWRFASKKFSGSGNRWQLYNGTISPKWQYVPLLPIFDTTRYLLPCRAAGEKSFYPYHIAERDKVVDCIGRFTERS